jgi:hypothetical protein
LGREESSRPGRLAFWPRIAGGILARLFEDPAIDDPAGSNRLFCRLMNMLDFSGILETYKGHKERG